MEDTALMEQLRASLLGPYEVRRTKKQKTAFLTWVTGYAEDLGVRVTVEESGKAIHSRNIVFGDVDKARTIITAHYDTCAWMPTGAVTTPGCWAILLLTELVQLVLLVPLLAIMFFGVSNPHTANDNTSGVLLMLLLMAQMKDRPDVAFVLFDNEETGLWGSQAFIRAHPQAARRFLLNLDCVGDGDTLLFTGVPRGLRMPQAMRLQKAMEEITPRYGMSTAGGAFPKWMYPSDQMLFPRGTALAALKGKKLLYLNRIHTPRDTVLEERNLLCLAEIIWQAV
ncbi:MAG: M28 family peptidase [Clostridia bacterium]|nr:M28 family peptidase [Clostridia bacterium]